MTRDGAASRWARWVVPLATLAVAAWILQREATTLDRDALAHALVAIPGARLLAACACTALSFAGLAAVEVWAVRKRAGRAVPAHVAAVAGSASHALCHVAGWHAVLGSLVRRQAYAPHGVRDGAVVAILLSVGAAIAFGTLSLGVLAAAMLTSTALAAGLAVAMVALALAAVRRRAPAGAAGDGWAARALSQLRGVAAILPVAALEAAACVGALFVLVPAGTFASWPLFVVTCLLAQAAGVVSHAPGGLGVFEAAMLASVAPEVRPGLLAAILAYRGIYGIAPFLLLALPWLVGSAVARRRTTGPA